MTSSKILFNLSRKCASWCSAQKAILSQEAYSKFLNSLSIIVDKGIKEINLLESVELKDRMKRLAEYYMRGRNTVQGEMTILSHELLRKPEDVNGKLQIQEYALAWCVELLMSYIIIIDDIDDGAKTRCGKPCWHLLPEVGTLAMNDASMLRSFIMELLKQTFEDSTYVQFSKLFNQAFFTCNVGQYMDAVASRNRDYDTFTMERYKKIATYKYAYYSSKFPILAALILSKKFSKDSCQNVDRIFGDIGIWSQINNDFTDFFDDDTRTGKTGSDIQAGKCTWLAVMALQLSNETQRREFHACYGSWEPAKVERIRTLYEDMKLTDLYYKEERSTYGRVVEKIQKLPADATPSPEFFQTVLDKYYPNVSCSKSFKLNAINDP